MLVVGARGFATELLEILHQLDLLENLVFYDDVNDDAPAHLYGRFPVLTSLSQVGHYFMHEDSKFCIGVGGPHNRLKLTMRFTKLGGSVQSIISPTARVGHFGTDIGSGTIVLTNVIITNSVSIGNGVLVNKSSIISHDASVGDFAQISPGVMIAGRSIVGRLADLGMGSIVLPGIEVGDGAVVGAGAVVTSNVAPGSTVVGVPAKPVVR